LPSINWEKIPALDHLIARTNQKEIKRASIAVTKWVYGRQKKKHSGKKSKKLYGFSKRKVSGA